MMEMMERFAEIAEATAAFPVDFDEAWQWVGYSDKRHGFDAVRANFSEGEDFSLSKAKSSGGRRADKIMLTTDCFKAFCMMAGTAKGKEVRRYYIDVERRFLEILRSKKLGKAVRRELTDAIQSSPLNESMHGFAYKTITDLIYKQVIGMDARHFREAKNLTKDANVREHLTQIQLVSVERLERLAESMVALGAVYDEIKTAITAMGTRRIAA
jgi:phage anti-repressor protein